jgi:hypothetical protein
MIIPKPVPSFVKNNKAFPVPKRLAVPVTNNNTALALLWIVGFVLAPT